jgi:3-methyladenine DNA glycosylase AlkC
VITKIADIKQELAAARRDPAQARAFIVKLRSVAASDAWQEREVVATALVELSKRHPDAVLKAARAWARHHDPNVRRAASEGLRRLVQSKPEEVRPILESLRDETDSYVKKSVANVLRNATRTQPAFVLALCTDWARSANPDTRWIVRDGLRKMAEVRPNEAMAILDSVGGSTRGRRAPRPSDPSR